MTSNKRITGSEPTNGAATDGVPASEQTYYCPECGVMEENWHLPTCSQPRSLVRRPDGVAMPWKPPPYPATPTEREALAKRRAALGVAIPLKGQPE